MLFKILENKTIINKHIFYHSVWYFGIEDQPMYLITNPNRTISVISNSMAVLCLTLTHYEINKTIMIYFQEIYQLHTWLCVPHLTNDHGYWRYLLGTCDIIRHAEE